MLGPVRVESGECQNNDRLKLIVVNRLRISLAEAFLMYKNIVEPTLFKVSPLWIKEINKL